MSGLISVCIVSGMRFRYLNFRKLELDPPWGGVMIAYWFTIEINVPIVIACIPTIKPLVSKVCPRLVEAAPGASGERIRDCPSLPTSASISEGVRDGLNLSTIESIPSGTQGSKRSRC